MNDSLLRSAALVGLFSLLGCSPSVDPDPGRGHSKVVGGGGGDGEGGGTTSEGGGDTCAAVDNCNVGEQQDCGECSPDDEGNCEARTCLDAGCGPKAGTWGECVQQDTPLVLSFDGAPIEFAVDVSHGFELGGLTSHVTDWPTARTPWLALDRDGSGSIEDGAELFGSMTRLADGRRARNGFEALAELDANGDGRLTAADPAFAKIVMWRDIDGDRRSSAGEMVSLSEAGIVSIDLAYRVRARCDARSNCEVERAAFTYRDATGSLRTGEVIDVHIASQR